MEEERRVIAYPGDLESRDHGSGLVLSNWEEVV